MLNPRKDARPFQHITCSVQRVRSGCARGFPAVRNFFVCQIAENQDGFRVCLRRVQKAADKRTVREKIVSVKSAPPSRAPISIPDTVTVGINAFRRACLVMTVLRGIPFARAVRI